MERLITKDLMKWKKSENRKPLIIRGARQVGKTYVVKKFGGNHYEDIAYFNFDHDEDLKSLFLRTKEPKRIIEQLIFVHGKAINPETTLIFFDEIQECPDALNSLKYFYEEASEFHVISAGSLLGIKLSNASFPVGKIEYLDMKPMTFTEYLIASGENGLVDYMNSIEEISAIPDIFYNRLDEKLKSYFIIGGMPEVVDSWIHKKDISIVEALQRNLLIAYENDFSKHISKTEANKATLIWDSIPSQLSRENKKFIYSIIKKSARGREYESALNWLNDANLLYKIFNVSKPALPLKSYRDLDSFKIYLHDVGLLRKMSELDSSIIKEGNKLYSEFKGALSENFVLNHLVHDFNNVPGYHVFANYEVDFVIQNKNKIIPIEVKSGKVTNNRSLTKYNEKYNPDVSIRLSMKNLEQNGKILNVPLFMVEYIYKLI